MKKNITIGLIAIVVLAMVAGCANQRVEQLSKMALAETNVPQAWTLKYEETEIECGEFVQMAGPETAYKVQFSRADGKAGVVELITICSSLELVPAALGATTAAMSIYGYQIIELPNPNIGDFSAAFKCITKATGVSTVHIHFTKNDKWVELMIWGVDYELAKELAIKAEKEIY